MALMLGFPKVTVSEPCVRMPVFRFQVHRVLGALLRMTTRFWEGCLPSHSLAESLSWKVLHERPQELASLHLNGNLVPVTAEDARSTRLSAATLRVVRE